MLAKNTRSVVVAVVDMLLTLRSAQAGTFDFGGNICYHLNFAGVDNVTPLSTAPVPGAILLGVLGLGAAGWKLRKLA